MFDRPNREPLRDLQSDILEALARGQSLAETCSLICRRIEDAVPDALCAIVAFNACMQARPIAAPSLPASALSLLDAIPDVSDANDSTTSSADARGIEVLDIETDPRWRSSYELPRSLGLRACWSNPIDARDGSLVGAFAFFYRTRRAPTACEREIVAACSGLCAIAIAHAETKSRVHELAYFDSLTGLPNRSQFQEYASERLAALAPDEALNVLCVDLDDFKSVNDSLGPRVGDVLLDGVAQRIRSCVGEDDFVARTDGDAFAVVQASTPGTAESSLLAQKLLAVLDEPFDIEEQRVAIGASIGIAQVASRGMPLADVSRRVDLALREAKGEHGHTYRFFAPEMESAAQLRRDFKQALRIAIDNGDFQLHYQPIVVLDTNELVAAEALLRWRHPALGDISPSVFVPIVEEMGLIGVLGDWVLREACAAAASWPRALTVGVNLSPLQFRKNGFTLDVVSALHQAGLPPQRLDLEVTESALLARDLGTRTALHELHDYGVRLSLDDFGTGYSSLQSLRSFPFDRIKIDMSFVRDIDLDADSTAIIRAIIRLAHDLGIRTTAEGIETKTQRDWLARHECGEGQGYWFSVPLSASAFLALLEKPMRNEELLRGAEYMRA